MAASVRFQGGDPNGLAAMLTAVIEGNLAAHPELERLLARVKPEAGDGRHEHFKSTQVFDGPYHQKQHALTKQDVGG